MKIKTNANCRKTFEINHNITDPTYHILLVGDVNQDLILNLCKYLENVNIGYINLFLLTKVSKFCSANDIA